MAEVERDSGELRFMIHCTSMICLTAFELLLAYFLKANEEFKDNEDVCTYWIRLAFNACRLICTICFVIESVCMMNKERVNIKKTQ